jgi:hypothetical protein
VLVLPMPGVQSGLQADRAEAERVGEHIRPGTSTHRPVVASRTISATDHFMQQRLKSVAPGRAGS